MSKYKYEGCFCNYDDSKNNQEKKLLVHRVRTKKVKIDNDILLR